jgi:hypothetical protein
VLIISKIDNIIFFREIFKRGCTVSSFFYCALNYEF